MFGLFKISFLNFIKEHKPILFLLMLVQIISLLAAMVAFAVPTSRRAAEEQYLGERKYVLRIYEPRVLTNGDFKQAQDAAENFPVPLETAHVLSTPIDVEVAENSFEGMTVAYELTPSGTIITYGRDFNSSERGKNSRVIIQNFMSTTIRNVGDPVSLSPTYKSGKPYTVVGTSAYDYYLLPISAAADMKTEAAQYIFYPKKFPTPEEDRRITAYIHKCFGEDYGMLESPDLSSDSGGADILLSGMFIVMFALSMINIAFVYRYILSKRSAFIRTARLCGATKLQCTSAFLLEMIAVSVASFALSVAVSLFALPPIIEFCSDGAYIYRFDSMNYLKIFAIYAAVILVIFIPFIRKYIGKISMSRDN